jgi:hypothetical protein
MKRRPNVEAMRRVCSQTATSNGGMPAFENSNASARVRYVATRPRAAETTVAPSESTSIPVTAGATEMPENGACA